MELSLFDAPMADEDADEEDVVVAVDEPISDDEPEDDERDE